jgi:hypothetical protein
MIQTAVVVLVLPLSHVFLIGRTVLPGWSQRTELPLADGRVFEVKETVFLQARQDVLAEKLPGDVLFDRSRVIGTSAYESLGAPVVRPAGEEGYALEKPADGVSSRSVARLVATADEQWLVLIFPHVYPRRGTGCLGDLAYDLESGAFYGQDDVLELSPFILVGPEDDLEPGDIEVLLDEQTNAPTIQALLTGIHHPNARVRRVVVQALAARREYSARARPILEELARSDEDAGVRQAAEAALAELRQE